MIQQVVLFGSTSLLCARAIDYRLKIKFSTSPKHFCKYSSIPFPLQLLPHLVWYIIVKMFHNHFSVQKPFSSHFCARASEKTLKKCRSYHFFLYLCTRNEKEVGFCEIPDSLIGGIQSVLPVIVNR